MKSTKNYYFYIGYSNYIYMIHDFAPGSVAEARCLGFGFGFGDCRVRCSGFGCGVGFDGMDGVSVKP
jgi:hypothetical protein